MSVEQDNKKLITEFMEVFTGGDIEQILSFLSDSATWWVAGTMEGISGTKSKADFRAMLTEISQTTSTGAIRLTPKAFTAEGDRVAVETESYAEMANGRVYNNQYHFVFEVRDGKIQSVREYLDTEHAVAIFLTP
jgi:ketosteroid isomerase-like protein